jgi:hypothetical protein
MAADTARASAVAGSAPNGLVGLTSTANRVAFGNNFCKSPSRFGKSSMLIVVTPVTLPPGRLKLATRPALTGSEPMPKTTGIDVVAPFAADAASVV